MQYVLCVCALAIKWTNGFANALIFHNANEKKKTEKNYVLAMNEIHIWAHERFDGLTSIKQWAGASDCGYNKLCETLLQINHCNAFANGSHLHTQRVDVGRWGWACQCKYVCVLHLIRLLVLSCLRSPTKRIDAVRCLWWSSCQLPAASWSLAKWMWRWRRRRRRWW